jgi:predicted RNase H-like HicB family nuclease
MKVLEYPVVIERLSAEDGGGYMVAVPDLAGCMSDGETVDEALVNVADAIACWKEGWQDMGRLVPESSRERRFA